MTNDVLNERIDYNSEDANRSANGDFDGVLASRLTRRGLLQRGGSSAAAALLAGAGVGTAVTGCASGAGTPPGSAGEKLLGFNAVGKSIADSVVVPEGYRVQVIYALGDPILDGAAPFRNDGTDADFDKRAGDHHDGMEWFGLTASGQPSASAVQRGLLAINHEATTDEKLSSHFLHAAGGKTSLPRPAAEVDKELMIHGLSVVEVQASGGSWRYQPASAFNRRVTTMTEAVLHGPARGHASLVTKYSPDATRCRGTLNNCGTGKTPWGTFVSGEENWYGYFYRDAKDDEKRGRRDPSVAGLARYSRPAGAASRHGWESAGNGDAYARWNNSVLGATPRDDYRNEMNTFGYVVELDAYTRQPLRKRTGLGRFAHESVSFAAPVAGQPIVAYMGDDARGEYMYKFVSAARWNPADAEAADRLAVGDKYLDRGTLFAAKFKDDGSGEWLELSLRNAFIAANPDFEFKSDADIAVFTRLAADAAGATKMDRPEWGGINPRTGEFYMSLTNNSGRTVDGEVSTDAANPRSYTDMKDGKPSRGNVNGHIIRTAQEKPDATAFKWDVYLFAAEADADRSLVNLSGLTDENDMSAPDGLAFSQATGLCWIQTDDSAYTDKTNCMLLAGMPGKVGDGGRKTLVNKRADGSEKRVDTFVGRAATPATLKRFLVGPKDCEITGLCETPDGRTLFINIQHPGETTRAADVSDPAKYTSQWPANAGYGSGKRPRSATIAITKINGERIGT